MGAFQKLYVGEITIEVVQMEPLFDQPVVREELVFPEFAGAPELQDVIEIAIEHFDHHFRRLGWGGVKLIEGFSKQVDARVVFIL